LSETVSVKKPVNDEIKGIEISLSQRASFKTI